MFGRKTKRIKELEELCVVLTQELIEVILENDELRSKLPKHDPKTGKFIKK